jgi:protein TonB
LAVHLRVERVKGGVVSSGFKQKWLLFPTLVLAVVGIVSGMANAEGRKTKVQVSPVYPELAKKMQVSGKVRVEVTIAPAGTVKNLKVLGGHPLLVEAATDALKKWKFEPGPDETTQVIEFNFNPND